jgi:pimeloyl-ACP methyl ester carboxylesterase
VVLDGLGHMTAIEDPERTSDELLSFLASVT